MGKRTQGVGTILYFIFALIVVIYVLIIGLFYFGRDIRSPPIDILSLQTNLYLTVSSTNQYLTAGSLKDLFLTSWNLIPDDEGMGVVTLRNAYSGNWIYYVPDQDGNANEISVTLTVRQQPSADPIGWFYIVSDGNGQIKLRSLQNSSKYMYTIPFGIERYQFVRIGDEQGTFRLEQG